MKLKIFGIIPESLTNGTGGFRRVIFGQGCPHNCEGCHNPLTHDFNHPASYYVETEDILESIKKVPFLKGVTFSGGDPFVQARAFSELAKEIRELGKDIWCYTGYTIEEILNSKNYDWIELLNNVDVLVDGRFIEELKCQESKLKGSENQRVINVKEFLENYKNNA